MKKIFFALIVAAFFGLFCFCVDVLGLGAVILFAAVFTALFANIEPQKGRKA